MLGVLLTPAVLPATIIAFSPLVTIILLFGAIGLLLVFTVVFAPGPGSALAASLPQAPPLVHPVARFMCFHPAVNAPWRRVPGSNESNLDMVEAAC